MNLPEELLNKLIQKKDLTKPEAQAFLDDVFRGAVSPVQTAAILTAFRIKGESLQEIAGLVQSMRSHMERINAREAIDIVGTGGAGVDPFNISTTAAFVVAGAGVKVAKHGNRAASSKCGSADVLEALGVKIDLTPQRAEEVFAKVGMVFLFAPVFHPAMKMVVPIRKELKIRTVFNILGPFTNPAGTERQLVGVPNPQIAETIIKAAKELNYEHLLIVTSDDGMDEVSISSKTRAYEIRGKAVKKFTIDPAKLGFRKAKKEALLSGTKEENAAVIRAILKGERGPKRDIVVLNSACALYVAGVAKNIKDGIKLAERSIDSGKAEKVLENLIRETNVPS